MASRIEPALGLYWYADVDPTIAPGVSAPLWQLLIRTDVPSIYYKAGNADTAWVNIGLGGGSPTALGIQAFIYEADGTETTAGFDIDLPVPRTDANYIAQVTLGDTAEDFSMQAPPSDYTTTKFTCVPGANLTLGDQILVVIVPTTA